MTFKIAMSPRQRKYVYSVNVCLTPLLLMSKSKILSTIFRTPTLAIPFWTTRGILLTTIEPSTGSGYCLIPRERQPMLMFMMGSLPGNQSHVLSFWLKCRRLDSYSSYCVFFLLGLLREHQR